MLDVVILVNVDVTNQYFPHNVVAENTQLPVDPFLQTYIPVCDPADPLATVQLHVKHSVYGRVHLVSSNPPQHLHAFRFDFPDL